MIVIYVGTWADVFFHTHHTQKYQEIFFSRPDSCSAMVYIHGMLMSCSPSSAAKVCRRLSLRRRRCLSQLQYGSYFDHAHCCLAEMADSLRESARLCPPHLRLRYVFQADVGKLKKRERANVLAFLSEHFLYEMPESDRGCHTRRPRPMFRRSYARPCSFSVWR